MTRTKWTYYHNQLSASKFLYAVRLVRGFPHSEEQNISVMLLTKTARFAGGARIRSVNC